MSKLPSLKALGGTLAVSYAFGVVAARVDQALRYTGKPAGEIIAGGVLYAALAIERGRRG